MAFTPMPATRQPALLLIDADETRAQYAARILTLADYCTFVTATPYYAFQRFLQEHFAPQAILLGEIDTQGYHVLSRLLRLLAQEHGRDVPLLPLPLHSTNKETLLEYRSTHISTISSHTSTKLLEAVWKVLPPADFSHTKERSLVVDMLPSHGLPLRASKERRSRNSHFRQILKAANSLMTSEQWQQLMNDVGLSDYSRITGWPPDDDARSIPAEYVSCLHQAVARSLPEDPVGQLCRWSERASEASLEKHKPSALTQQVLHLVPAERVLSITLQAFTDEINEIRGEELHLWKQWGDRNYLLVHYSNLYVYGRSYRPERVCHVWIASLEVTLRLVHLDNAWEVIEVECGCQTQTGHCLFLVRPKKAKRCSSYVPDRFPVLTTPTFLPYHEEKI